jgi:tetratricopeptide (TPR) repeat protein
MSGVWQTSLLRSSFFCGAILLAVLCGARRGGADQVKLHGRPDAYVGQITRYYPEDGSVNIDTGSGEITLEKRQIEWIRVEPPSQLKDWLAASTDSEVAAAIAGLKSLMDKILGIPEQNTPWVAQAALWLGELYRRRQIWSEAAAVYERVRKLYPPAIARHAELGLARVKMGQQQFDEAAQLLEAILKPAGQTLSFTPADSAYYAGAYIARGDVFAAGGQWREALTSYLTVTVLCYHDKALLAEARYKAGQMFEKISEWMRAAEVYSELLKDAPPQMPFLADVKKRLEQAQEKANQPGRP